MFEHTEDKIHYIMKVEVNVLQRLGFPTHKLKLKVGATVMLSRNLESPKLWLWY